jgi:hypothetical protein
VERRIIIDKAKNKVKDKNNYLCVSRETLQCSNDVDCPVLPLGGNCMFHADREFFRL